MLVHKSAVPGGLAAFLMVSAFAANGLARQRGIVSAGCSGCHGGDGTVVEMTASPESFEPDEEVTFTVSVQHAGIRNAGVYITSKGVGTLFTIAGQNLAITDGEITHSAPKTAEDGKVTFEFGWRAPAEPGGVRFEVYALAGNANGASSGDNAGEGFFSWAFGCEGQEFFPDYDQDGFGSEAYGSITACAGEPPEGYSELGTDCNEVYDTTYPGAPELCNERDDNCNGEVDEDSMPVEMWPDPDGDGYYDLQDGEPLTGCLMPGYAWQPGDCAPNDPMIHPGAEEVCNLFDDDCNGRVDDRVRPQCGVGFCRRESFTCSESDCFEGVPADEICNALDDDCDGDTDEGDLCDPGEVCVNGKCLDAETAGLEPGATDPVTASGAGPLDGGAGMSNAGSKPTPAATGGQGATSAGGAPSGATPSVPNNDAASPGTGGAAPQYGGTSSQPEAQPSASGCGVSSAGQTSTPFQMLALLLLSSARRFGRPRSPRRRAST